MTPTEHYALTERVAQLETQLAEATARNRRLRTELAQVRTAARALATYGRTENPA